MTGTGGPRPDSAAVFPSFVWLRAIGVVLAGPFVRGGNIEYTAKDQLAQWEEGDRILREDFNRDNARMEAALADMLHQCEAIKSVSLGSTQSASLDLSDSDWGQWSLVGFTLDLRTVGSATAAAAPPAAAPM